MKEIAVLGSTGSIGTQTLDVIRCHPDLFHAQVIAASRSVDKLLAQAEEFHPKAIVISDEESGQKFREIYHGPAEVIIGKDGLCEAAVRDDVDLVLVSVVGTAGLLPTLKAIEAGKELALANKETLVAGGALVLEAAKKNHILIRPVDSEHSAIFQSMLGQDRKGIHKILLTASGGPFRGKSREELAKVTVADAMKHPTWNMGMKVTLDSATMFNKGLEVIEAHWLFDVDYDDIEVIVQPQSLIHSMVEYNDGSIIAQLGNPDMRLPIQFALTYPERLPSPSHEFVDWSRIASILIEKPDLHVFRSLKMAYEAGKAGGDETAAFNASNEEAIRAFIAGRLSFLSIFDVVEDVLGKWQVSPITCYEDVVEGDRKAREMARNAVRRFSV
jgi:1-deoxy-D-xylulose-5-phosphate reductoisomerase